MTTPTSPTRPRLRARSSTAALVAAGSAAAAFTLTAAPALAHDQLVSTTPAADATVEAAPSELTLTFSNDLISGQGIQNLVTVTDEAGHQWQDGDARVTGPELSAPLCEGLPNGEFQVAYRVVYSDGHSEARQYAFTLEDPDAPDTAVPQDCGVPNPDAPVSNAGEDPAGTGSVDGADGTGGTNGSDGSGGDAVPGSTGGAEPAATGEPSSDPAAAGPATDDSASDTAAAEDTAESDQAGVPAWVWAVGAVGVLVVAAAVLSVFRRARALDGDDHGTEG